VARPTQKRRKSARTNARARAVDGRPRPISRQPATLAEQTMFFPRLRRQAKWMFVFLALVFGLGFVIFGVGSNLPSGLGDILQDVTHDSAPSVDQARERAQENPRDPAAQLALADALQQNQRPDEAIAPLERYLKVRPRDEDALRQLAGLYSSKANRLTDESNLAALAYQEAATGQLVQPKLSGKAAEGFFQGGTIEQAVITEATDRYTDLIQRAQAASKNAARTYKQIAQVAPRDPQVQLLLANAAEQAGDIQTTITAYERFLKLAPQDSSAPAVRRTLRDLRKQAKASGGSTSVTVPGG
jgi:tetratricopeptide (TPR) repeat protein